MPSRSISMRCLGCRARIKASFQLLGEYRRCPGCGHPLMVRLQAPPEAGPMIVLDDRLQPEPARRFD
jgi:hypothetical protein